MRTALPVARKNAESAAVLQQAFSSPLLTNSRLISPVKLFATPVTALL